MYINQLLHILNSFMKVMEGEANHNPCNKSQFQIDLFHQ